MKSEKKFVKQISLLLLAFLLIFCSKDDVVIDKGNGNGNEDGNGKKDEIEQIVTLNQDELSLKLDEEIVLKASFGEIDKPQKKYVWQVEDDNIVTVTVNKDDEHSATIKALKVGETMVAIQSDDGKLKAECKVTVVYEGDGVIRILAIGNSFSQDAIENNLYDLAKAENIKVEIANMYIGGASLDLHLSNALNNKAEYQYNVTDVNGRKSSYKNTSIATALADKDWDYISFQQHSPHSGLYDSYTFPLPRLFRYVKERATNPNVKYILHQTWAYEQSSTHSGFANYNKNQITMYNAIVETVWKVKDLVDIDIIVPAGTAIQNGRTSIIGDNFCRDGYHLDLNIGRYTAACAWFETLFDKNVVGNSYRPSTITEYEAEIAQNAAHFAVLNPKQITEMKDYQSIGDPKPLTNPVFISFGLDNPIEGWNGLFGSADTKVGSSILDMKDRTGKETGISLRITERFNSRNTNGEKSTSTEFDMPVEVSSYSYYGNSAKPWSDKEVEQSGFVISGLMKDAKYNFCFFSSRNGVPKNESREVKFILKGKNEVIVKVESANNKTDIVCAKELQPNSDGEILVTVTAGENNTNEYGFYYLNAMRISPSAN